MDEWRLYDAAALLHPSNLPALSVGKPSGSPASLQPAESQSKSKAGSLSSGTKHAGKPDVTAGQHSALPASSQPAAGAGASQRIGAHRPGSVDDTNRQLTAERAQPMPPQTAHTAQPLPGSAAQSFAQQGHSMFSPRAHTGLQRGQPNVTRDPADSQWELVGRRGRSQRSHRFSHVASPLAQPGSSRGVTWHEQPVPAHLASPSARRWPARPSGNHRNIRDGQGLQAGVSFLSARAPAQPPGFGRLHGQESAGRGPLVQPLGSSTNSSDI